MGLSFIIRRMSLLMLRFTPFSLFASIMWTKIKVKKEIHEKAENDNWRGGGSRNT